MSPHARTGWPVALAVAAGLLAVGCAGSEPRAAAPGAAPAADSPDPRSVASQGIRLAVPEGRRGSGFLPAAAIRAVLRAVSSVPRGMPALTRPPGVQALAVVTGGRLWTASDAGGIAGRPVSAAALAPDGKRIALARGRTLALLTPDGRRLRSWRMRGPVAALTWRGDGRRIAYVARLPRAYVLGVVAADGSRLHPQLSHVHSDVRPVPPVWRGRAVIGVDTRNRVFLDEQIVGTGRRFYLFARACNTGFLLRGLRVRALAVAPRSGRVALISDGGHVVAFDPHRPRPRACVTSANAADLTGLAWISPTEFATTERARGHRGFPGYLRRYRVVGNALRVTAARSVRGTALLAVAAAPTGDRLALLAVGDPRRPDVLPPGSGPIPLAPGELAVWTLRTPRGGTRPQPLRARGTHLRLGDPVARRAFLSAGRTALSLAAPPRRIPPSPPPPRERGTP